MSKTPTCNTDAAMKTVHRAIDSEQITCHQCCDMGQNDTIDRIELIPSNVLSSDNTNCKNNIQ